MPQMSPTMWTMTMITLSVSLMVIITLLYFKHAQETPSHTPSVDKKEDMAWRW